MLYTSPNVHIQIRQTKVSMAKKVSYYSKTNIPGNKNNINLHKTNFSIVRICVATASPFKFPEALTAANVPCDLPEKISRIFDLPTKFEWMKKGQNWEEILRTKIVQITESRK
jgi:hypothetical protein